MEADYPGDCATPDDFICLADEYRRGAEILASYEQKGKPQSRAAARLLAAHAIELYLNAHLRAAGLTNPEIRALGHDLRVRAERSMKHGLSLRARTARHLMLMSDQREYLVTRYGPERLKSLSPRTQILASMTDVAMKVKKQLRPPVPPAETASVRCQKAAVGE